jgi:serine protease
MTFLAAHVNDDRAARARITRMTQVRGGGNDFVVRDYTAPSPPLPGELDTIEYHSAGLGDYFLTTSSAEAAVLDAGLLPGWTRTGFAFKSWSTDAGRGVPACRFFGKPGPGPYAHFYTIDANECAFVAASPAWIFEGTPFSEEAPTGGDCAADRIPVMRVYNNFMGGQVAHRYLTSKSEVISMIADGWVYEGAVFCSPP